MSRAGLKLVHGLENFGVNPAGRICLDVGASTGGFSQVLRANGAALVYAVDVGHGQLHQSLHADTKIISMERTDARNLTKDDLSLLPDLIVCDVSFISCMKALKIPLMLAAKPAEIITLVKPQFEVGKERVGKGGIVRDQGLALDAVKRVKFWFAEQGWEVIAQDISPIKGGSGNAEYLLHARSSDENE